jgi:Glycosyl hydrolases family 35
MHKIIIFSAARRSTMQGCYRFTTAMMSALVFFSLCTMTWADAYEIDIRADQREIRSNHLELGDSTNSQGHSLGVNSLFILRDGRPWLPVMGEIHYSRVPREDWDDAILKMKANGIEIIATYVFWIHHEEAEGQFDWSGNRSLRDFVTACQRHNIWVLARIGPWCHGEARNGGFPDWLLAKESKKELKTRSADASFLKYVDRLYREIGKQLEGLYFKDGGPVLGIQLENELRFNNRGGYEYMKALKRLAVGAGIKVPFYTCTGWPGIMRGQKEFLPMAGGYPDAPWDKSTKQLVQDVFRFNPLRNDPLIGADLLGKNENKTGPLADNLYPNANAELGGGVQVTYHRRPIIAPEDAVSPAFARLGSGANLLGYYMFHGGLNPEGKLSTLQESRATKYPNDCPIISYDFQAPLGEWGQVRESYYLYRPMHYFINDFGSELAEMYAFFPKVQPKGPKDNETLRCAARAKDGQGFVFLSNCQRYGDMHDLKDVQVELVLKDGRLKIPETPVTLDKNAMAIWPFNLQLADARLIYSTAQPLCIVANGDERLFVFFASGGVPAQYVFDAATVKQTISEDSAMKITRKDGEIEVDAKSPGTGCLLELTTAKGESVKVLTLTQQQAQHCWRGKFLDQTRLVLTYCTLMPTETELRLCSTASAKLDFALYPDASIQLGNGLKLERTKDGIFTRYSVQLPERRIAVSFTPCDTDVPPMPVELAAAPQPGPQYDVKYKPLPGSRNWRLNIPSDALAGLNNVLLQFDLSGDTAALYLNDKLVDDWFIFGPPMTVGLKHFTPALKNGEFKLQLLPLTEKRNIFLEDPDMKTRGMQAELKSITALPEYEVTVQAAAPAMFKK